jgi:hypothetical protein
MMRRLLVVLLATSVLAACTDQPPGPAPEQGCGGPARSQSVAARHPGEEDEARSAAAQAELAACATKAGWRLRDLDLKVDAQGRLIGLQFRAVPSRPGLTGQRETIDRCLAGAGVTRP